MNAFIAAAIIVFGLLSVVVGLIGIAENLDNKQRFDIFSRLISTGAIVTVIGIAALVIILEVQKLAT